MAQSEKSIIDSIKGRTGATHVTNNGDGTYSWKQIAPRSGDLLKQGVWNESNSSSSILDTINAYNQKQKSILDGYKNQANSAIQGVVSGGQQALNYASGLLNLAKDTTAQAQNNFNKINKFADDSYNLSMNMTPGINNIDAQGDNMLDIASRLFGMQEGNDLAGQYVSALKAIDPNRYVSMAASDVQNSYSNAQGQMQRAMSRQGMGASAQAASLQKNWGNAMAAALAGAKTKARQQGISERLSAMGEAMGMASGLQKQGVEEKSTAMEFKTKQIQSLTSAGQMTQAAAEGLLSSVDTYNKAVGTNLNAAEIFMKAQDAAAVYYSEQAEGLARLAQWNQEQFLR